MSFCLPTAQRRPPGRPQPRDEQVHAPAPDERQQTGNENEYEGSHVTATPSPPAPLPKGVGSGVRARSGLGAWVIRVARCAETEKLRRPARHVFRMQSKRSNRPVHQSLTRGTAGQAGISITCGITLRP